MCTGCLLLIRLFPPDLFCSVVYLYVCSPSLSLSLSALSLSLSLSLSFSLSPCCFLFSPLHFLCYFLSSPSSVCFPSLLPSSCHSPCHSHFDLLFSHVCCFPPPS